MNKVKRVALTRPPTITMAKGREVSAPTPCDKAAGSSPSAAISAVMTTGTRIARAIESVAEQLAKVNEAIR